MDDTLETQQGLLEELSALSPIAYDRQRDAAAKRLGIRVQTLDSEVALRRPQPAEPGEVTGNERRGVPRGTLRPLDPAPTVALAEG